VPGAEVAILDVRSIVTRLGKLAPPAHLGGSWSAYQATEGSTTKEGHVYQETESQPGGTASAPVDRPVMPAQQFTTTARVPLGKPVILAAMTFAATGPAGLTEPAENPKQLHLIATTSIGNFASPSGSKKQ
jgi:hypothetical protein